MKNLANYLDDFLDEEENFFESNKQKFNKIRKPNKEINENHKEKHKKSNYFKK